ncbi:MAG: DNA polymerase I [Desulfobacterales bacterium]|nr:DNA polymerase I [Desulfobacterales bacterium]
MSEQKTVYLIDGSAYIYRAYHAIRNLSSSKGLPTNAVFGFARMLISLMETKAPEYLAICFDVKGPTFRHEIYPEYKANRPPMPEDLVEQIPWIKKVVAAFRIPVVEVQGYEADDLIGTLAQQAGKAGFEVVMVTGDKDFMQLVTDKNVIWDPMKDKTIDREVVEEKHGVAPLQVIQVMGLSGDTADNIPGVPGVGPKTASSLVKEFGSIENLYQQIDSVKKKKLHENLIKYQQQALVSLDLVTIRTDAPVAFDPEVMTAVSPDNKQLAELFRELEFRQLQKLYPVERDLSHKDYRAILDLGDLEAFVAQLLKEAVIAVDTETTSVNPMLADLVGISFASTKDAAVYIPCAHDPEVVPGQLGQSTILEKLRPVLENGSIKKIGQNIKYDWIVFARHGIDLQGVFADTMLMSYLLDPSKRAHGLDRIADDFLDHQTIAYEEVAGKGKKAVSFDRVPLDKAVPYACEDADITLMAYNVLAQMLEDKALIDLLEKVEMPLIPVLMRMEMTGIRVDTDRLKVLSRTFEGELESIENEIYQMAGETFNIKSSQQLGHILFEKLELPVVKKTRKTKGYSTDVKVLTILAEQHALPALVLRQRTLSKLKSTYTDALLDLVLPETGRIHTSFNQTVAATGRLSSSDPNLQNIPIRTEEGRRIRGAFVPREGWTLVSADYSQIELRLLAHCSGDSILIKAFEDDEDIHTRTATEVFQTLPGFIDDELRRQAKVINFGIIYGMSPFGLSQALKISQKMAKTYIDSYFGRYQGVKQYIDDTIAKAREERQISTLLGRVRLLPDIVSTNHNVRQFAERTAVNTPIQGTAADLIKLAMINVDAALAREKMQTTLLLSVHDEIVFESPPEELTAATALVTTLMESVWDLDVPLKVNAASGKSWAEAH